AAADVEDPAGGRGHERGDLAAGVGVGGVDLAGEAGDGQLGAGHSTSLRWRTLPRAIAAKATASDQASCPRSGTTPSPVRKRRAWFTRHRSHGSPARATRGRRVTAAVTTPARA